MTHVARTCAQIERIEALARAKVASFEKQYSEQWPEMVQWLAVAQAGLRKGLPLFSAVLHTKCELAAARVQFERAQRARAKFDKNGRAPA